MVIFSSHLVRLNLQMHFMLAFATVVLIQAAITGAITMRYIQVELEQRIGELALHLSNIVSKPPPNSTGAGCR